MKRVKNKVCCICGGDHHQVWTTRYIDQRPVLVGAGCSSVLSENIARQAYMPKNVAAAMVATRRGA